MKVTQWALHKSIALQGYKSWQPIHTNSFDVFNLDYYVYVGSFASIRTKQYLVAACAQCAVQINNLCKPFVKGFRDGGQAKHQNPDKRHAMKPPEHTHEKTKSSGFEGEWPCLISIKH